MLGKRDNAGYVRFTKKEEKYIQSIMDTVTNIESHREAVERIYLECGCIIKFYDYPSMFKKKKRWNRPEEFCYTGRISGVITSIDPSIEPICWSKFRETFGGSDTFRMDTGSGSGGESFGFDHGTVFIDDFPLMREAFKVTVFNDKLQTEYDEQIDLVKKEFLDKVNNSVDNDPEIVALNEQNNNMYRMLKLLEDKQMAFYSAVKARTKEKEIFYKSVHKPDVPTCSSPFIDYTKKFDLISTIKTSSSVEVTEVELTELSDKFNTFFNENSEIFL